MKSIIISAFPGMGKSWAYNNLSVEHKFMGFTMHDSDSSLFSWLYDENGNKTKERNPEFPANYIAHIKELYEQPDNIIFVSSHDTVREALVEAKLPFWMVVPRPYDKERYMSRYVDRGNDDAFIKLLDENFEKWVKDAIKFGVDHKEDLQLYETSRPLAEMLPSIIRWNGENVHKITEGGDDCNG